MAERVDPDPDPEEALLDGLVEAPEKRALTAEYVYENSGHRLFCSSCKAFRRAKIDLNAEDPKNPILMVQCKTCDRGERFVLRENGTWMPEPMSRALRSYAMWRAREILGVK